MTDHERPDDELARWPQDIVLGEQGAVRVFWLQAEDMQGLVDRLALVLSEHMAAEDELHVTYNAMLRYAARAVPRELLFTGVAS